ncbi:MAG: hypothetical protein ACXABD_04685 [Candidatus Thorarchaeota archaeon]|jgi:hypothetical protein
MTERKIEFGLISASSPHLEITNCDAEKCGRPIKFMEKCFIDSANGAIYCNSCGVCTRYERQKAAERKSRGIPEIKINGE